MFSKIPAFKHAFLPQPPKFRKLIGPSFIILGLGLGSGEIILWPYLVSNFGLGIIWAAALGVLFQFFINLEIERYTLVRGESVFVGFTRMFRFAPIWFIFSTFVGFGWPGIIAASAQIVSRIFGFGDLRVAAIAGLVLIGLVLTVGPVLYKTVEKFQKLIIFGSVPAIFLLTLLLAKPDDYLHLFKGMVGQGSNYSFFPEALPFLTFLGAFAFAGAGGNLNLSQSYYIKEKGYGMGKYAGKIHSLISGRNQNIGLEGTAFQTNEANMVAFGKWWKLITLEHFLIFFVTGVVSIFLLALLAFSTTYGISSNVGGINFIFNEAVMIGSILGPQISIVFLLVLGIMLFATQLTVLDSTSRIISENFLLMDARKATSKRISVSYYVTLWVQIFFGICVFLVGFSDPKSLVVTAAVINALTMFVHIGFTYLMNTRSLPVSTRPTAPKRILILAIFIFFGAFSSYSFYVNFFK